MHVICTCTAKYAEGICRLENTRLLYNRCSNDHPGHQVQSQLFSHCIKGITGRETLFLLLCCASCNSPCNIAIAHAPKSHVCPQQKRKVRQSRTATVRLHLKGRDDSHLRTYSGGKHEHRHEGDLAEHSQHQRVSQHKQLIAQAQLLVVPCPTRTKIYNQLSSQVTQEARGVKH